MSENIGGGLAFQATLNIDDFKVSAISSIHTCQGSGNHEGPRALVFNILNH